KVKAEALDAADRRRSGCDALAADHVTAPVFRAVDQDRGLAERAVQMRLDDLQREPNGDRRIEGVAAALEYAHPDGGSEPMGRRDNPEGAADLGARREAGHQSFPGEVPVSCAQVTASRRYARLNSIS